MNAIEIEEAVSALFEKSCDRQTFVWGFLEAFGNKPTVIKRLQSSYSLSDIDGAVLLRNNIHLKVCAKGDVSKTFNQLKDSTATKKNKVKFVLATDGFTVEAEDFAGEAPLVCEYADFPNHFGYFLPLAGIETVKQIRDSSFDIRATSRLNRLYVELLKDNPEWGSADNRHEMNHFMARLIFCFFAEDTGIIRGNNLFTITIEQMSDRDSSNTNQVISEIFRALNTKAAERNNEKLPRWVESFPYVNGGLFSGNIDVPKFSKIARSYLLHIGSLDWTKINPDIFGSMIQAVADDEERGSLGMHYTSVPNILKVLNPLFLDDLRYQLDKAGNNARTLLNLRKRISKIRVFDPACGSGNFLVVAYKQMREIESQINTKRGEFGRKSEIPLTNFRGIEIRDFSAEVARLALIIAEFQCDVIYRGQKEAIDDFLPLDSQNWITSENALRVDWITLFPPTGKAVKILSDDLFRSSSEQSEIDFENEGGETYICGNPPYRGSSLQNADQKSDLQNLFKSKLKNWKNLDYISGWFLKASEYVSNARAKFAFVSTNSICQGQQVPLIWPLINQDNNGIYFAHTSFKWTNLASRNAGVTVAIVGIAPKPISSGRLYADDGGAEQRVREVSNINAYLVSGADIIVEPSSKSIAGLGLMVKGNQPSDGGHLCFSRVEQMALTKENPQAKKYLKKYYGAEDFIQAKERYCLWIDDKEVESASAIGEINQRLHLVSEMRAQAKAPTTRPAAAWPHRFIQIQNVAKNYSIVIPRVSSERREYLPVGILGADSIISDSALAIYDEPIWNLSILVSKIHMVWIKTVCGQLETRIRYSNTLGWNTFPLPLLTEKNKSDLTKCAENILLAREAHFPATIADLYEPDSMPQNLRDAHDTNDEVLERIYIGRRFKNDTERLEKLFELYTKMAGKK
jgi:hypothetical protein